MASTSLAAHHCMQPKGGITALNFSFVAILCFGLGLLSGCVSKPSWTFPWSVSQRVVSPGVYGVNVDMAAMISGTPYTVTTAGNGNFFDLAADLGINTLRITDARWALTGKVYSQTDWRYVFNEANSHHMHVILLLVGTGSYSATEEGYTLLVQYRLARAPALWLIDLDNEPDVSDAQYMAELQAEAAYVRHVAPTVPITIGGWKSEVPGHPGQFYYQRPTDIPRFIDLVDVVSPHLYGFDQADQLGFTPAQWTRYYLDAVRQQAHGKPILLEEFGASNGLAPTTGPTPTGSPDWQAAVYRGVLQAVVAEHHEGVLGAVAWIIAPRPPWPASASYQGDMTGWAFVLDGGRRELPAAHAFSAASQSG